MSTDPARKRTLGRSDIAVSTVAMGCWAIVGDATWGHQDEQDAIATIHAAMDCGINFFDTAEGYGAGYSEQLLQKALGSRRNDVVIGSKVSPQHTGSREALIEACENSLRNLGTDYIDVYHLHWPNRETPLAVIVEGLTALREAGKIRSFAVSNFGKEDLTDLLALGHCDVNQLPYNLLWRVIEHEIVPICLADDVSITCYSPIAQGLLTGKFASPDDVPPGRARTRHFSCQREQTRHGEPGQEALTFETIRHIDLIARELERPMAEVALAWLIHQPGVASVLVGARNPEQIRANAAAMALDLNADVLAQLGKVTQALRDAFGNNPDMWQSESRYR